MSGHERDSESGTNTPTRRACGFRNSLKELTIGFYDMTADHLCTIVSTFLRGFPNVSKFYFADNGLTFRALDSLTQWLKVEARKHAESGKLDANCCSARIEVLILRDNVLLGSTEGLRSVIRLLDVVKTIADIGYYIGDDSMRNGSNGITHQKEFTMIQLKVVTKLNFNAIGRVLTSKGSPAKSTYKSPSPSTNNDKHLIPVSAWANVIYRASRKAPCYVKNGLTFSWVNEGKPHISFTRPMSRTELQKETKEWQASSVYFLIREGLVGRNEWHNRIGSATNTSSSSSSAPKEESLQSNRSSKRKHGE